MATYTEDPMMIVHSQIPRPSTPRPVSNFHLPSKRTSYHSLRSPVLMSPIGVQSYSSYYSDYKSAGWPDINIISPSVASHCSFYSDNDTNEGFRSPRLALQTSNLLGYKRSPGEGMYTPIEASAGSTPISPSADDFMYNMGTQDDSPSPDLELMANFHLDYYLQNDNDELYTPISPSASQDQDGAEWLPDITIKPLARLELLTSGHSQFGWEAYYSPITPPELTQSGKDEWLQDMENNEQPKVHSRHHSELYTPISPSTDMQNSFNAATYTDLAFQANALLENHTPYDLSSLHSPEFPFLSDCQSNQPYNNLTLQTHSLEGIFTRQASDLYSPISASPCAQRRRDELLYDIATPAERFFVPDFQDTILSTNPCTDSETKDIAIALEACAMSQSAYASEPDNAQLSTPLPLETRVAADREKDDERPRRRQRSSSLPSRILDSSRLDAAQSQTTTIVRDEGVSTRRRHSINLTGTETRQVLDYLPSTNFNDEGVWT